MHTRSDLDPPHLLEPGPGGGLLRDLGSNVVVDTLAVLDAAQLSALRG